MNKSLLLLMATLLTLSLRAQMEPKANHYVDSMEQVLQQAKSDTSKASILYLLADYLSLSDSAKAIHYIKQGLHLVENEPFYQGLGHFYLGRIYFDYDLGKAEKAFQEANKLFEGYKTAASYIYASRSWANIANIAQRRSDEKAYTEILLNKAVPLAAKGADSIRMAVYYMNIALPFINYKDFDKALQYLFKANDILSRQAPKDLRRIDLYTHLAKTYILQDRLLEAKTALDCAAQLLKQDPEGIYAPNYYSTTGMYYINSSQWAAALKSLDLGLELAQQLHSQNEYKDLLYQKARLFAAQKDFIRVKQVLQQIEQGPYLTTAMDKKQLLHDLAEVEAKLGNMSTAYGYMLQYSQLSDSLHEHKMGVEIAKSEAKYHFSEKEKQLLVYENKAKSQRLIAIGSVTGLLLATLFFAFMYRQRKMKAAQQLNSLKQKQQTALTEALLQGEEKERTRLARDLHDGLGGMLAGVKINLSNALQESPTADINRVIGLLDDSVSELRRIARNMMPEALVRSGLQTALTDLCQSINSDTIQVEFSFMDISKEIKHPNQVIIYRIIQELLTNVLKHAQASELFLQCSQRDNTFYITVEDNGIGMNPQKIKEQNGQGLENIRSRVDFLRGKLDISTGQGKGTITNIEIQLDGSK